MEFVEILGSVDVSFVFYCEDGEGVKAVMELVNL